MTEASKPHKAELSDGHEVKAQNRVAIEKMSEEVIGNLTIPSNSEHVKFSGKSNPERLISKSGQDFTCYVSLVAECSSKWVSSLSLSVMTSTGREVGWRKYFFKVSNKSTLNFKSDVEVYPEFEKVGIGRALIALDEKFQRLVARVYKRNLDINIDTVRATVSDQTNDQNPGWTTRQFSQQPDWNTTNGRTWQRVLDVSNE